ncbi:MAG: outer membrane lipoprotein carrier protein LolA [Polyangiaceae bacterium]|nr:outer membrane lipoprotein carrier protein LolA [Polyangiaceae bacterium]
MTSSFRAAARSRSAFAPFLLLALAAGALGCEDDPAPPASLPAATATVLSAPTASAIPSPPEPIAEAGAPDASAEIAAAPTATAAAADAGPIDAGTKQDAGKKPVVKDAGAAGSGGSKQSSTDAGTGDTGGPLVKGTAPPPPSTPPATTATPSSIPPPAPGSADEIAAQVDTIFLGQKTFKAAFKQEHTQKISGAVKKSSGTVFVEKPNKLSFRYAPPNNNRIVSDGTTLKVFVSEDSQMFVQPVEKTEYPGALSFLMGSGLRPSFTFTIHDKAKFEGGPVLNGKPRAPTPYYEYVLFYVDKALLEKKDPGVIRRVLIVDAQGNRNRFDFENVSQPASIDPGEFVFSPPPGTNIQEAKK